MIDKGEKNLGDIKKILEEKEEWQNLLLYLNEVDGGRDRKIFTEALDQPYSSREYIDERDKKMCVWISILYCMWIHFSGMGRIPLYWWHCVDRQTVGYPLPSPSSPPLLLQDSDRFLSSPSSLFITSNFFENGSIMPSLDSVEDRVNTLRRRYVNSNRVSWISFSPAFLFPCLSSPLLLTGWNLLSLYWLYSQDNRQ